MKIVDSSISMTSRHTLTQTTVKTETFQFKPDFEKIFNDYNQDVKRINFAREHFSPPRFTIAPGIKVVGLQWHQVKPMDKIPELDKQKIQVLEKVLSSLIGKPVHIRIPRQNSHDFVQVVSATNQSQTADEEPFITREKDRFFQENETLAFQAQGVFKTDDGKEVKFETSLNLGREFASLNDINLKSGEKLVDPLIINYSGPAAVLTDTKFSFDIDSNGKAEQISFVSQGSGFLCLDANKDGKITSGSELFGVKSGDGFADLAAYDQDDNNWIDENDPIFDNLQIWTKDNEGKDQLFALGQKGIGAIYLGNVEAGFDFKNQANQLLGENRRAGIFARENGTVGTIQEADLVVV